MLNPDGAERTRRTNAQGIDINRDALRLQTPEGRFLKSVRDRLKPSVGYNLHNHSPNVTAGKHGRQVAISLLSVPFDDAFTVNEGRRTTMRMAVLVRQLLEPWAKDRVARYDMDYTARAFGDSMTRWGTPTLLIESGGFFGPDEANTLVRLNFVALLGHASRARRRLAREGGRRRRTTRSRSTRGTAFSTSSCATRASSEAAASRRISRMWA